MIWKNSKQMINQSSQGKSGSQVNDLKKARMLKDCNSYKAVFVSLSFTFAERQRICELYVELHKRNDAGRCSKHYIDRRGPVQNW